MTDSSEIAYRRGELSPEQVRDEIARFWADVKPGSEAQAQINAVGLGSAGLSQVDEVDAITVRVGSSGADPASVV